MASYVTNIPAEKALKIGLPGVVEITMVKELEGTYKTSIADMELSKKIIYLSIPTYKGRMIPIPKGVRMNVKIFDKSSMFSFTTVSLGVIKRDNLYMLPVLAPDEVKKTERRKFKRIPLYVYGILKKSLDENSEAIQFLTKDFSAGGIKFVTNTILKEGDIIYVTLNLDDELQIDNQKAKIVRVDQKTEEGYQYGAQFLEVPRQLENKMVRFVFQKEIKAKK
ncbi:MAG TPA: pilus assembly protein PilZ [Thermosipho africanus]|jgi:c-di-GMP-binding flagellar brake protein YcgR|uniref:Type IV pilus assembly protein PilZ n=1 Tax=Thermosipho africanus (strain TCF52B) TaxID=484019 RepID=B7IDV8_THEAB|nr:MULTISPECIES: PilZ domain-containing protein [Thermosipho]HCF38974.1 pilus assembly protein PilZ [Thermosipho africanus]ACJ76185.1 type IV pilus assembly protein PilZ [Thermosipho africanus TCF52B]MBZ4649565.1 type pilus assembly protein PilZ [Thermosipho sp. (in: thermotogales)]MDK2839854.1 hypothetical protein [Thermosipho sp. (in: thermotogales)]MDK2900750.1 hypothetical protein [Thermosipho sp. (in: thermotogales)]